MTIPIIRYAQNFTFLQYFMSAARRTTVAIIKHAMNNNTQFTILCMPARRRDQQTKSRKINSLALMRWKANWKEGTRAVQ